MHIKFISWIDKEAEDAALIITDGTHECLAFCHPCRVKVGDTVTLPLQSLDEKSIVFVDTRTVSVVKREGSDSWEQRIIAVIEDKDRKIVGIGGIKIALNQLPGDLKKGETIECYINM